MPYSVVTAQQAFSTEMVNGFVGLHNQYYEQLIIVNNDTSIIETV